MQSILSSLHKLIIFVATGFAVIYWSAATPLDLQRKTCETTGCNEAAQNILKNLDTTVNPCDNFFRFACGNFLKESVIPEDKPNFSLFSKKTDVLEEKLKQSIEAELEKSDPKTFKLLQSYYNVCLNTENIEKTSMEELKHILNNLGNWPVVAGRSWNQSTFDWQNIMYQLRKVGLTNSIKSIVKFGIETDDKNTSRNIITLDQASTGINQEYLSKGLEDKVVQAYYKYMVELAEILGANKEDAEKELAQSLNFEIELARISLAKQERRNMSKLYNLKTVSELQSKYPYILWNEYFNQLVSPQTHVELFDEVKVKVPSFLESLSQLVLKTPKRVLANYIIWRAVEESAEHLNEQVRKVKAEFDAALKGTKVQQARWVQCIDYVSNNIRLATGALYVRKNFDRKTKSDVELLVTELRKSYEDMIKKIDWMDEDTKKAAQIKLNAIQAYIAYPEEFFDNQKLDEHFQSLQVNTDSFLKSHLNLNLFNFEYKLKEFRKPVDKTNWLTRGRSAIVNAFYQREKNGIQIPAGILQEELFSSSRPNYMNYGAIGYVIGHELTHGFDDRGSQYDKDGNLVNWWNNNTRREYLNRAQCIIDQYSNYTAEEVALNLNGKNTQGENIADNGGVKEAYFAYENYERQNGEEPRLPGLPYSPRQMFWISTANVWCGKRRPESLKNIVITNEHSPEEFRVIGPLSNMPQFSKDFNCPLGAPMNPVKKCTVW